VIAIDTMNRERSFGLIPKVKALHLGLPLPFNRGADNLEMFAMNKQEEWRPVVMGKYKYMASSNGRVASIKSDGSYRIRQHSKPAPRGYFVLSIRTEDGRTIPKPVHEFISLAFLGAKPKGFYVDHINRNRLDNSVENLRYVSPRENALNSENTLRKKYGTLPGACFHKSTKTDKKWHSYIKIDGRSIYLGSFKTEIEAHLAYIKRTNVLQNETEITQ